MPSLRELQLKVAATLLDPAGNYAAAHVIGNAIPAQERIGFYRNNVISNFRRALRTVYPVIERLVGAPFIDHAADRYIRVHPSVSGDLNRFGEHFADFLETWPSARELPYLADVARLEWSVEESFHAADRDGLRIADLAAVPPDRQDMLTFDLHPSCRLLVSSYPIHLIWQINQPGSNGDETVDLAQGGVYLLVRRRGHEVVIEALDHGGFCMFSLLAAGQNLGEALRYATSVQSDFNVVAFLQHHLPGGAFAGFDWPVSSCSESKAADCGCRSELAAVA
jgi:hypothetical protein